MKSTKYYITIKQFVETDYYWEVNTKKARRFNRTVDSLVENGRVRTVVEAFMIIRKVAREHAESEERKEAYERNLKRMAKKDRHFVLKTRDLLNGAE